MIRLSVSICLSLALPVASQNYAVASIRGAADGSSISGTVKFEQSESDPLGDMTVTYSITGLPAGQKGFHVHQFGDTRVTDKLTTMAAHFVPFCLPPEMVDGVLPAGGCEDDSVHGLPPSVKRQPGDMGNIDVVDGVVTTLTIGQGKMSLTDSMRSIVGRSIVIHSKQDLGGTAAECCIDAGFPAVQCDEVECCLSLNTGRTRDECSDSMTCKLPLPTSPPSALSPSPAPPPAPSFPGCTDRSTVVPELVQCKVGGGGIVDIPAQCTVDLTFGAAGDPLAYGVIGLGNPTKATPVARTANGAKAPSVPKADKIACTFEASTSSSVSGVALLTLQQPCDKGSCTARMQAKLFGMTAGASHSFHFHEWGDMTVDVTKAGELGAIYYSQGIEVSEIAVLASGEAQYDVTFTIGADSDDLLEHVGRSLTVHEGPDKSTPTIAAAACGLANPLSKLESMQPAGAKSSQAAVSGGVVALVVVVAVVFTALLVLGGLFFFRKPIPFCGKCIYGSEGPGFSEMSVPPPPRPGFVKSPSVGPPSELPEWSQPPPGPPPDKV